MAKTKQFQSGPLAFGTLLDSINIIPHPFPVMKWRLKYVGHLTDGAVVAVDPRVLMHRPSFVMTCY